MVAAFDIRPSDTDRVVHVRLGPNGRPVGASAHVRIDRPIAEVWAVVHDFERYASHLPMVHRVRREGDRITLELKFRIGIISAGFQFTAAATFDEGRAVELRWVAGEPRGVRLRFELTPVDDGRACMVQGDGEFELQSLGWLVKYFLKHHPEIEFGIFPGVALVLIDALERAVKA